VKENHSLKDLAAVKDKTKQINSLYYLREMIITYQF